MWKMQETHPKFRQIAPSTSLSDQGSPLSPSEAKLKESQQIGHAGAFSFLTQHICFYLLVWLLTQVVNGFLMNTFVLVAYADDSIGGLGLQPQQIASILMARTIMIPLIELPLFAKIHRRFGSIECCAFSSACLWCFPCFCLCWYTSRRSAGLHQPTMLFWQYSLSSGSVSPSRQDTDIARS